MDGTKLVQKVDIILKQKNLKRQALAEYCGVTTQAFSDWYRRGNLPVVDVVLKMTKFLGVSIEWLLEDNYEMTWSDFIDSDGTKKVNISPCEIMYRIDYQIQTQKEDFSGNADESFYAGILDILSMDMIRSLKNNRYEPNIRQLFLLSQRLNLSLEYLITGHNTSKITQPDYFTYGLAQKYVSYLRNLNCLHDEEKAIVKQLIDSFFSKRIQVRELLQARGIDTSDIPELN